MQNIFGQEREETCLILGDTMDAMPFMEDSIDARAIRHSVHFAIVKAIENGFIRFVVSLGYGVGLWAAESVLALKRSIPFLELEILEAPETESEGELEEYEFDSLMERMEWIRRWAKSACLMSADTRERDLLALMQPGLLLLFSDAEDEAMAELAEIVKRRKYRAEWHSWKLSIPASNVFPPLRREEGERKSTL